MRKLLIIILTMYTVLHINAVKANSNAVSKEQPEHLFNEITVTQAQKLMQKKQLTSHQLTQHYINRINQLNKASHNLNAVAVINPNALTIAKERDRQRQAGNTLGKLHGIPILLKDNIDTGDGMANTGGSLALKNHFPKEDAFMVKQLREAGAVILGKANLSEWANFRSTKSSSGWSAMWGQTRNPYDLTTTSCGSSAGSGVAVAANLTLLAIGTETDGSVTCPAAINGIVGIKPTLGTVSRQGIIPIAHSQDTAGPMARTVTDAVLLLEAMTAFDKGDVAPVKTSNKLSQHLNLNGLENKRIGIARNLMGYHDDVDEVFLQAVEVLKQQGAIIIDNANIPHLEDIGPHEYEVLLYEFKHDLNTYFAHAGLDITLEKLIAFNKEHSDEEMPYFKQEIFLQAQAKGELTDKKYLSVLADAKRLAGKEGIDAIMDLHQLDLLIAPTTGPAWKIDAINGDHFSGSASSPAAVSGYPHITVPMGFVHHLPIGMSFFGRHLSESTLIEAAYSFEQHSQARQPPELIKQ